MPLLIGALFLLTTSLSTQSTTWTLINQSPSNPRPPGRSDNDNLVYDEARGEMVLFGGIDSAGNRLNDTWVWDRQVWVERQPATRPPIRNGEAMAYDSARSRVVMFGGVGASGAALGDTWEWDGTNWVDVSPAQGQAAPTARHYPDMAYDADHMRIVLFGGGAGSTYENDTWTWDGTSWTFQNVTRPPGRNNGAMTFDRARRRMVLFGGWNGTWRGDTWEWDGGDAPGSAGWVQTALSSPTRPSPRRAHTLDYDDARGRCVLFGGTDQSDYSRQTWEWDGTIWTLRTLAGNAPPKRQGQGAAYDPIRRVVVMYGGSDGQRRTDMWEYGPVVPATVHSRGAGCADRNGLTPTLESDPQALPSSLPWLGETFELRLRGFGSGAFDYPYLLLGHFSGSPYPVNLAVLGRPQCWIYFNPVVSISLANRSGGSVASLQLPSSTSLLGQPLLAQGVVIQTGPSLFEVSTSNYCEFRIGQK